MRSTTRWTITLAVLGFCGCGGSGYDPGETTASLCQDELDNDGDGKTDCDDDDCQGFVFCDPSGENSVVECRDGEDNDGDGTTDCDDTGCMQLTFCIPPVEETSSACQDGEDNDEDGLTDCEDDGCRGFVFCLPGEYDSAACQDEADNDADGLTDCDDPDCGGFVFCMRVENDAASCADGVDNDGDGRADCADTDCQGFVFCHESDAVACQDGADNDGDGLTDCDDPGCGGYLFCGSREGESTRDLCHNGEDDDADGLTDCDDPGCWPWGFCGHYQGFPLVDTWGETWDGFERPPLPYQEARAVCQGLGGRLPTVTELWRNNASSGTADLSDTAASTPLWTLIASIQDSHRVLVALGDGQRTAAAEDTAQRYRCVWPDDPGAGFDVARCHGSPEEPCWAYGQVWNLDAQDRPELDYVAASNECAFYGASVPAAAEWNGLIHAGLPGGSGEWVWAGEAMYWYNGHYGYALVSWTDAVADRWEYLNNGWGGVSDPATPRRFRCIGLRDPGAFEVPAPACHEGCATIEARRSVLVADDADRIAAPMWLAATQCRSEGATLPAAVDATEAIHAGWGQGTDAWLWVTDAMYWYNAHYGNALVRWTGEADPHYAYIPGRGGVSLAGDERTYRCIWRQHGPEVPDCPASQVVVWQENGFGCVPGADGDDGGNAFTEAFMDDWGNAWDSVERPAQAFAEAQAVCQDLGARLPTATEVYAVRFEDNPHPPVGDITDVNFLWTGTRVADAGQRAVVRVSDGGSARAAETTTHYFRCIWPAIRGEVLSGDNCYGPAGEACFRTAGGVIADKYDRVALDVAGAVNECLASGGHLPDLREVMELQHGGWSNGTDTWNWMGEFVYFYNGGYGYALYKWNGEGHPEWSYANPGWGALSWAYELRPFRCVYSTLLR